MRYEGFYVDLYVSLVIVLSFIILYIVSNPKIHHRQHKVHNAIGGASTGSGTYIPLLHGSSIRNRVDTDTRRLRVVYSKDFSFGSTVKPLYVERDLYLDDIEVPPSLRNQMR